MPWHEVAAIIAAILGVGGLGAWLKIVVSYKRLQEQNAAEMRRIEAKLRQEEAAARSAQEREETATRISREREIDKRGQRLIDELHSTAKSLGDQLTAALQQIAALHQQQATLAADAQQAREARARMHAQYEELSRRLEEERSEAANQILGLKLELDQSRAEVAELKAELQASRSEVQRLRGLMKQAGIEHTNHD